MAFTATQIPNIEGRKYPAKLAGRALSEGDSDLRRGGTPRLIEKLDVDEVVFSYSDVIYNYVMDKASLVMARGADFKVLGAEKTMIRSTGFR